MGQWIHLTRSLLLHQLCSSNCTGPLARTLHWRSRVLRTLACLPRTHIPLSALGQEGRLGHPLPWRLPRHRDLLLVADFFFFPAAGAEPGVRHAPWGSSGQAWVGTAAPAPLSARSPPEGREALHWLQSSEPSLSARRGRRVEGTRGPSVAPAFPAASPPPFGPGINSGR